MTDDLIRPLRGAYPGPAIEPDSSVRDQLALLGKVGVRYGGLNNATASSLLTDLVAYWKLDTLAWADSVGSNSLTNNGSVTVGTPKVGAGSAEFDGTNSSSLSTTSETLNISGAISISLWAYLTGSPSSQQVIVGGYSSSPPFPGYGIGISLGAFNSGKWTMWQGNGWRPSTVSAVQNVWAHLVVTVDASGNGIMYVNGAVDASWSDPPVAAYSGQRAVGANSDGANNFFEGRVDEVGIWKRVLTSSEMSTLYNGGSGLSYPFS